MIALEAFLIPSIFEMISLVCSRIFSYTVLLEFVHGLFSSTVKLVFGTDTAAAFHDSSLNIVEAFLIPSIFEMISLVCSSASLRVSADFIARFLTSLATTAKPLPF